MTDEPRDPNAHTEVHRVADPSSTRVASYLAEPGEVGRVLLLYSGGLDTSVMLKWIQDEYEAEVVALTINLGQPGEDYGVVKGKAEQLGAVAAEVVDAAEKPQLPLRIPIGDTARALLVARHAAPEDAPFTVGGA